MSKFDAINKIFGKAHENKMAIGGGLASIGGSGGALSELIPAINTKEPGGDPAKMAAYGGLSTGGLAALLTTGRNMDPKKKALLTALGLLGGAGYFGGSAALNNEYFGNSDK
jgi:hypothetical protein